MAHPSLSDLKRRVISKGRRAMTLEKELHLESAETGNIKAVGIDGSGAGNPQGSEKDW